MQKAQETYNENPSKAKTYEEAINLVDTKAFKYTKVMTINKLSEVMNAKAKKLEGQLIKFSLKLQ